MLTAFLIPVSNHWSENSDLGSIKKANSHSKIQSSRFGYHPDIKNEFWKNFKKIMLDFRSGVALQKIRISQEFSGFEKL